jgi:hypothetical protein
MGSFYDWWQNLDSDNRTGFIVISVMVCLGIVLAIVLPIVLTKVNSECHQKKILCPKYADYECILNEETQQYDTTCKCNGEDLLPVTMHKECDPTKGFVYYCASGTSHEKEIPSNQIQDCLNQNNSPKCSHGDFICESPNPSPSPSS